MEEARAAARSAHKSGGAGAAERMANGAALRVLEKHLGFAIKRNRDPGKSPFGKPGNTIKDGDTGDGESQVVWKESG